MGLLDSLKSTFTSSGEASVPPAASFATREGASTLLSTACSSI